MTFNYRGMTLWPCTLVQGCVRPFPTTPEMLRARSLLRRKGGFVGMTPTAETAVPDSSAIENGTWKLLRP